MDRNNFSRPVDLKRVHLTDDFWKGEMELIRKEVIPYQWETLNDRVEDAAPSYCMHNFKVAGKMMQEKREQGDSYQAPSYTYRGFEVLPEDPRHPDDNFYGFVFQDSDFYKWIEAVAYSLTQHPDEALEAVADEAIDIVCAAQQDNGYLDTYYIINGMDKIFTNLKDHHELYCFGHLAEGAVAYYQATGKDKLLTAAVRYANFIADTFGEEEGKCKGYPGHEIAEMALVRLYEATGEARFLNLARFFIDERGTRPYYFDKEHPVSGEEAPKIRYQYQQAHLPVREQKEAVGHAVRAVYLYSGMADLARLTEDRALHAACRTLWDSVVKEKMYLTGGVGGTNVGEAFSFPFDLPNDTAYAETCASIGLVFFARRMLEIEPDSRYADVMELALHNGILSGMALDGKSFFYVNPLSVLPRACKEDARKSHVKPVRQKWFGCACCPPNLARLVSSVGAYAFTEKEDTLFVHLYAGGTVEKQVGEQTARIQIESGFPWEGNVRIRVEAEDPVEMTLALRIPGWEEGHYTLTGAEGKVCRTEKGYLYVTGSFRDSDVLCLDFPMEARLVMADSRVREDAGKLAVMRGPVVYCAEEADNGKNLDLIRLSGDAVFTEERSTVLGEPMVFLNATARRRIPCTPADGLYQRYQKPAYEEISLRLVPYYAWANRGEGEMQVWMIEG